MSDAPYLYMYFADADTSHPYYVGIGVGTRAKHRKNHTCPLPSDANILIIPQSSYEEAWAQEQHLISKWGRRGIDQGGVLYNKSTGGPGRYSGCKASDSTRAKLSASKSGSKNPIYGHKFSDEHRQKLSLAQTGRKHSEASKKKRSESMKAIWANKKALQS